ncbi:RluA family pseudouridine synthase [Devosia sp. 63-57]|uniref:RluA family pseudouridine synthase n=1 Tax=Devosia sp. 63-57 TaxID=1895751 RepID=UPI00086960E7|nr:RluA family pseudouridine synthase [Devosia sp. 63-57]ODT50323.1 MAG: RNA pseudouridine synthase [Pelagibacterium sp. SCN 63-126]ODU86487.1 MAG: RNA pseudouridine synthase [Pelagibacterium sp. SCN 63-17]OJX45067.1 MAG: RNA pseudouridine synthase [Devosia sp. 63-57]
MSAVQHREVSADEEGMRLDRWFARHFPQVGFGRLQKLIRNGEVRVDKAKVETSTRLSEGQVIRIPPVDDPGAVRPMRINEEDVRFLEDLILYQDDDIFVFNKPHGLAVQGGSGTTRHLDGLLKNLPNKKGETPKLVHRLDRDTSGCLVVAKTSAAATHFGSVFRSRSARKIYWAIVAGNPTPRQGEISCFLAKQSTTDGEQMVVVRNGTPGAVHSSSYYSTTDTASRRFAWVTLKPVTGRTHQLRVHMAQLGTPIIGDPRYFNIENWMPAPGLGEGLHLHARRLVLPLRNGKKLDVSAPLPPHMLESFEALGFDANRYDAQSVDPEDAA